MDIKELEVILKNKNWLQVLRILKKEKYRLLKTRTPFMRRLREAKEFSKKICFKQIIKNINNPSRQFFKKQLKCSNKKFKAYKFTFKNKLDSLALMKQCENGYTFLSEIFILPSEQTLLEFLNNVQIGPGIDNSIFNTLKDISITLQPPLQKYCFLIFDEMALTPKIYYNPNTDTVEGLVNDNCTAANKIADHVQVFMLRCISKNWVQPITYRFISGPSKSMEIVKTLKEIIRLTEEAGFYIVGTICDEKSNFKRALDYLVDETKTIYDTKNIELFEYQFECNDHIVIPLFDPPHLLKSARNDFLTKHVLFELDDHYREAQWDHIKTFWMINESGEEYRMVPKLTESHVCPEKMDKKNVSLCSEVFSDKVAEYIKFTALSGLQFNNIMLPKRAEDTAVFVKFMDSLFDSVNGYHASCSPHKILKSRINLNQDESAQSQFWMKALTVFDETTFDDGNEETVPQSIKNWKKTLENLLSLVPKLKEYGFKYLSTRNLNQDPLENFLAKLRYRSGKFVNPTCSVFTTTYKGLLMNPHCVKYCYGGNCEDDKASFLLSPENFVYQETDTDNEYNSASSSFVRLSDDFPFLQPLDESGVKYVVSFIAKLKMPRCTTCHQNIFNTSKQVHSLQDFIQEELKGPVIEKQLKMINPAFFETSVQMYNIALYILKTVSPHKDVFKMIHLNILTHVTFEFVHCKYRCSMNKEGIINKFVKNLIFNYYKKANNILLRKNKGLLSVNSSELYKNAKLLAEKRS